MIRFERTKDRRVGNLWIGSAYVGAIDHGVMKIVPHLAPYLDKIKANLPARFRSYEPVIGIPAQKDLPFGPGEERSTVVIENPEAVVNVSVGEMVSPAGLAGIIENYQEANPEAKPDPPKRKRGRPPGAKNKKKTVIQKPTENHE